MMRPISSPVPSGEFNTPLRRCSGRITWLFIAIVICPGGARSDDFSQRDPFFAKLAAPMTSVVDGKSFRDAIQGIADQAELNLCLDRRVDATAPVLLGEPAQPTVYAAIEKVAAQRDCVAMPVAGVLLVGRQEWVHRTASSLLSMTSVSGRGSARVSWEDLTTPRDALAAAVDSTADVQPSLPHDLWPANSWKQIDRRVAATLILAQFDQKPESTVSLRNLKAVPAESDGKFKRRYQGDPTKIRNALNRADGASRVRVVGDWLEATAGVEAHRAATGVMLAARAVAAGPDPDKDRFTLKARATAENAFMHLAQSARKTCVINEDARAACQTPVTIDATDETLRNLIKIVAKQAGVTAVWRGNQIIVSKR